MVADIGKNSVYARTSFDSAFNVKDLKRLEADTPVSYAGNQCAKDSNRKILFELDIRHNIEYISPDMNAILGYDPHEVIGKSFSNFVILSDLPDADRALEGVISDEKIEQLKVRVKFKYRKIVVLKVKLIPIIANQKVAGIKGVARVISVPRE